HHDGEGPHLRLRPARRRRHAPEDRRRVPGEGVPRRPHLQQPSPRLCGRARHARRLRGGGPDRAGGEDGRRPPRADGGARAPPPGAPPAPPAAGGAAGLGGAPRPSEPWAPSNGPAEEMAAHNRFFREQGLYPFARWNTFSTTPPLTISEAELMEGLAIVDKG